MKLTIDYEAIKRMQETGVTEIVLIPLPETNAGWESGSIESDIDSLNKMLTDKNLYLTPYIKKIVAILRRLAAEKRGVFTVPAGVYPNPFPVIPQFPQFAPTPVPYVGDPPAWSPNSPTVICANNQGGMTQANGQGDDSGTRGD